MLSFHAHPMIQLRSHSSAAGRRLGHCGLLLASALLAAGFLFPRMAAGAAGGAEETAPQPLRRTATHSAHAAAFIRQEGSPRAIPVTAALPAAEEAAAPVRVPVRPLSPEIPSWLEDGLPVPAASEPADASIYYPHVWPVRFSEVGYISSGFAWRTDPITGEQKEFHQGVDFADRDGTRIFASAAGRVLEAESSSGYGLYLLIDHGNGYQTRYSHCSELVVQAGDEVSQGQVIAFMGATGRVTGTHCDFRVYLNGVAIDPMKTLDPAGES